MAIAGMANIAGLLGHERRTVQNGFVMPRTRRTKKGGTHRLYGPRDRQSEFNSGLGFLIHVARNCAAAFEQLAENQAL